MTVVKIMMISSCPLASLGNHVLCIIEFDPCTSYIIGSFFVFLVLVHPSAFSTDQRILIAVTKFDHHYSGDVHELEVWEVQRHVKEGLEEIGITVPTEQIVPVCGEWALIARLLKANIQDRSVSRRARLYHQIFLTSQNMDVTQNMSDEEVAGVLEDISSITRLEQR